MSQHLGVEFAVIAHLDGCKLFRVAGDQVAQAAQQLASGGGRQLRPGSAAEGTVRSLDGQGRVLGTALRHLGPLAAGEGVGRGQPAAGAAGAVMAIDQVLEALKI
ncbi:hypothetical protein D9M70_525300 [compost metagenome]